MLQEACEQLEGLIVWLNNKDRSPLNCLAELEYDQALTLMGAAIIALKKAEIHQAQAIAKEGKF